MLTVRVGKIKMTRQQNLLRWTARCILVLVPVVVLITLLLQKNNNPFTADWTQALSGHFRFSNKKTPPKPPAESCQLQVCAEDHFGFFMRSGAANIMGPKICIQDKLVLGTVLNNAGPGINIVTINGKTGEVIKTEFFNMYSGQVEPLIEFLKNTEEGSVVLMASFDEPSTKLNDDARKLIAELGSTEVKSLGFRDNWVFVGGKAVTMKDHFEKYIKNEKSKNKYDDWPEIVELQGCVPKLKSVAAV